MLLSRSNSSLDGLWLAPELCTSVWGVEDVEEEGLLAFELNDSLFGLEEVGRDSASSLFGAYPSGFY